MTELNTHQIKNYLPHRYPFLLLDKVISVKANDKLIAVKNITANEPFFQGHFPEKPVMPGVLIIEAMAQASAMLGLLSGADTEQKGKLYYLVGADKSRFRKTVEPGDQLIITSRFVTARRNIWKFACIAEVDGRRVADTDLLTTIADP